MDYKVEGIILKSRDIREYDRLYVIFSKEIGKIEAVGVGVRKPAAKLAGALEPLTRSEISLVRTRWLDKITSAIAVEQYPTVKKDLDKTQTAMVIAEALSEVAQSSGPECARKIFQDLEVFLGSMEERILSLSQIKMAGLSVLWKIIGRNGLGPSVFKCAECLKAIGRETVYWFHIPRGVICPDCRKKQKDSVSELSVEIDKDDLKILRFLLMCGSDSASRLKISEKKISKARSLTSNLVKHVIEREFPL